MIKLKIEKYREFTEEEKELNKYSIKQAQVGIYKHCEGVLEVEITEEQFSAIRKAVLEVF